METCNKSKVNIRKILGIFLIFCMAFAISSVFMPTDNAHAEGYKRYCECCNEWVNSEDICELDDTIQHCINCCEDGAGHCCICEKFDPSNMCMEEPAPHCLDCCDGRHCHGDCSPSEDSIGDHVCPDCGYCEDCTDSIFGMHECEICGDCLFIGGSICEYHENGYHHEDCCGKRHCISCNRCEEIEGVDICDDCKVCTECAPEDEHFCEFCGECMYSTVNKCDLDEHHCSSCCENGELHCAECGEFDESNDCPDCEFCTECAGDNGSDEHYSEISGECLNAAGACEHGLPITQEECEEILCEECGGHFGYDCEPCEFCLDEGIQRCTDCCESSSGYDSDNNLCQYDPEYQEHLCPICGIHENETSVGELCPDCGLCEECCLKQVSTAPEDAILCTDDFHCTHFCTVDNQCEKFCTESSKCNGTVCTHSHLGAYANNETMHWKTCTDCNAKVNFGKHDFEWININNNTAQQKCKDCGYITAPQAYHVHDFGGWETSGQYHTRKCTVDGCTKIERAEHTFDGNTCTVCGFTKTNAIAIKKYPEKLYLPADITAQELLETLEFRVDADYYLPFGYIWSIDLSAEYASDAYAKYGVVLGQGSRFTLTDSDTETDVTPITTDEQRLEVAQGIIDTLKGTDGIADCSDSIEIKCKVYIRGVAEGAKTFTTELGFEHLNTYPLDNDDPESHEVFCSDCHDSLGYEEHNFNKFGICEDCGYSKGIKITKQPKSIKQDNDGSRYYSFSVTAVGADLKYQWYAAGPSGDTPLTNCMSSTVTVKVDPTKACEEYFNAEYFCKVYNDDQEVISNSALIILDHCYELKDYNGTYHVDTCKYCGDVDPESLDKKKKHEYDHSTTYAENRYDIIVPGGSNRAWLTDDILKSQPELQQDFIDLYCGSDKTGDYWSGVFKDTVATHTTSVCKECGYVKESDGTFAGSSVESLNVWAKDCDWNNTFGHHSPSMYNNDTIHWNGCSKCCYIEPGSVGLHEIEFKSSNIIEEDGKYYKINTVGCKECNYTKTTKTEITEEEATKKTEATGSFITGGEYFSKVETEDYPVTWVRRTHTIEDVPNDKKLFGYVLHFVADGEEDDLEESHIFLAPAGDTVFIPGKEDISINCEKVVGTDETDYEFIVNIYNQDYKSRDFKVVATFANVATLSAEEGTLYKTDDKTATGTQNWTGDEIVMEDGDIVYYKADAVTNPNKVLTGLSKVASDGQPVFLNAEPVVAGELNLYKLTANLLTSGDITVKSTYVINNGSRYTVGFDNDNDPATPAINLAGTYAQGAELTIPQEIKYYGTAPDGKYFSHWTCAQMAGEYLAGETFNVVGENMVFTPVYLPVPPKTIPIAYDDNKTSVIVNVPATSEIYAGQTYTIDSAVPELDGYTFKGWSTTAKVTTTDGNTLAMYQPGSEIKVAETNNFVILRAVWEENSTTPAITHTITATAGTNGTISPSGAVTVADGGNKTFTFAPDAGYKVDKVTVDGTAVTIKGNIYTMENVKADMAINVTFTKTTIGGGSTGGSGGGGGSYTAKYDVDVINGSGDGSYKSGEWVTITADEQDGKTFSHWTSDEVTFDDKNDATTKFKMGSKDVTVTAVYEDEKTGDTEVKFEDVKSSDWFNNFVYDVVEKGLFAGTSDTTFSPNENATRAMVWTVLARMAGADLTGGDIWYSNAQNWAMENEVSDGTDPNNFITREQFVTMIWRNQESPKAEGTLEFADNDKVSDYAYEALVWAVDEKIITGKEENTLDPQGNLTRAEMATILSKLTAK